MRSSSSTRATRPCRRSAACTTATARARKCWSPTGSACRRRSTTGRSTSRSGRRASARSSSCRRRRARTSWRRRGGVVVEQIIRPTGLIDPPIEVRPVKGQVDDLLQEIRARAAAARARARDDADQADGGGPDAVLPGARRARPLPALGHRDARARRDPARPAAGRVRRAGRASTCCAKGSTCRKCRSSRSWTPTRKGFLRSAGSLIQTSGRAARNVNGRVIMYADTMTDSMRAAIGETDRRRARAGGVQRGARHHAAVDRQADRRRDVERLRARLRHAGRRRATAPSASGRRRSSTRTSRRSQERDEGGGGQSRLREGGVAARRHQAPAQARSWGCRGRRGGPDDA